MKTKKLKIDKKTVTKLNEQELTQIDGGYAITNSLGCHTAIVCFTQTCPQKCGSVVE